MKHKGKGSNPNSLKNLKPIRDAKRANELREKGIEVRKENTERRQQLRRDVQDFRKLNLDPTEMPPAVEVLRAQMVKAISEGDMDEATRMATILAPYETPKLAAQELNVSTDVSEKTDAELEALAKEFGISLGDEGDNVH